MLTGTLYQDNTVKRMGWSIASGWKGLLDIPDLFRQVIGKNKFI